MYPLISLVFNAFQLLILARVLLSWVPADPYNPIIQFIFRTTEPFLAPIRRVLAQNLPNIAFDLSPIVVLIAAAILQRILFSILFGR